MADEDQRYREKMLFRLQEWKSDGFDTSAIEERIGSTADIRDVKREFNEFKDKVRVLKDIELDLLLLDTSSHEDKAEAIKRDLRDIAAVEDVTERYQKLKELVQAQTPKETPAPTKSEKDIHMDKLDAWSKVGYKVTPFEKALKGEKDLEKIRKIFDGLEKKIEILEKVRELLAGFREAGFEDDVRRIERMVFGLGKLNTIWKEVYVLRSKVQDRKKEVVKAEATTKPVKVKIIRKKEPVKMQEGEPTEPEVKEEVLQFRRIDLYIQLLQTILLANKRLLTLDTLRMTQRGLKKENPKIMFFLIQKDFKIKSMMPDHPDSYRALEAYLNRLYNNMCNLISEVEAKERMRKPAKEYITAHIQEILSSGLDDYFPVFLLIEENEIPDEKAEVQEEEGDEMERIKKRVDLWTKQGYKVDRLAQAIQRETNIDLIKALYSKTEEEIFWLRELEKDVQDLEKKGLEKECREIRAKLNYPERITEIEDDILSLQMMLDVGHGTEDDDLI